MTITQLLLALAIFLVWHELRAIRSRIGPPTMGQRYLLWQHRRRQQREKRQRVVHRPGETGSETIISGLTGKPVQATRTPARTRQL